MRWTTYIFSPKQSLENSLPLCDIEWTRHPHFYFQISDHFSDNEKPPKKVGENIHSKAFSDLILPFLALEQWLEVRASILWRSEKSLQPISWETFFSTFYQAIWKIIQAAKQRRAWVEID